MGSIGSWEQEGSRIVHEMVRLADSVERVATTVHALQTDVTVIRTRRLSGVAGQIVAGLAVATLIALAGAAAVLWRDVGLLQVEVARLRSRQDYALGRHWEVPPNAERQHWMDGGL